MLVLSKGQLDTGPRRRNHSTLMGGIIISYKPASGLKLGSYPACAAYVDRLNAVRVAWNYKLREMRLLPDEWYAPDIELLAKYQEWRDGMLGIR